MYEKPTLNRVGEAQDVILGSIYVTGEDLDTLWIPIGGIWADDAADSGNAA